MIIMQSSLLLLDQSLSEYLLIKENTMRRGLQQANAFLDDWLQAKVRLQEANEKLGTAFNPLSLIPLKETTHSRIIGELLNPHGNHGQGRLFLECFLNHFKVPEPEIGDWSVSVEEGHVDIMLWREKPMRSVVLIENKSNDAKDQPNQIYRYWHQQIYLWDPHLDYQDPLVRRSFRVIYLPADRSKAPAPHSLERPADWEHFNPAPRVPFPHETFAFSELVTLWQREVITRIPTTNIRLIAFLNFYHEHWAP